MFIQAQIKENTKAAHHWPLWGEFTNDRCSPHKGPVTREMFSFDDVIMDRFERVPTGANDLRFYRKIGTRFKSSNHNISQILSPRYWVLKCPYRFEFRLTARQSWRLSNFRAIRKNDLAAWRLCEILRYHSLSVCCWNGSQHYLPSSL